MIDREPEEDYQRMVEFEIEDFPTDELENEIETPIEPSKKYDLFVEPSETTEGMLDAFRKGVKQS